MDLIKQYNQPEYTAIFQSMCGILPVESPVAKENRSVCNGNSPKRHDANGYCRNHGNAEIRKTSTLDHPVKSSTLQNGINPIPQEREHSSKEVSPSNNTKSGSNKLNYVIKYKSLFCLFKIAAFMGDEVCYLMIYPFAIWNLDSLLVRKAAVIWCMVMYLGQAMKDLVRWPRPASPPVFRLENTYQQEYGMPSTHAMAATAIPFTFLYIMTQRYDISLFVYLFVALLWCVLVCLSRLYLGVHSVSDVVCGILYALLILIVFLPCLDKFDWYQQTHPLSPFVMLIIGCALCTVCYPNPKEGKKSAKGDAVEIVAGFIGLSVGSWINYQFNISSISPQTGHYQILSPSWHWLGLACLRFIIGAITVALVRLLFKFISIRLVSSVIGLERPSKDHPTVNTFYKFITYFAIGLSIFGLAPQLFSILGIQRNHFYYEVK